MNPTTEFRAADTETVNRTGEGWACLLIRMGLESGKPEFLEFPGDFNGIFDFFAGGRFVFWNMDFDARAIIHPHYLPWEAIESLGLFGSAQFRIGKKRYSARYVSRKFLSVSDGARDFIFYDLMQFYDSSLESASQKFLGEGKLDFPESWYSKIDRLLKKGGWERERILKYAGRDVDLTQRHLDHLLGACRKLGLNPSRLTSAASLAKMKFGKVLKNEIPSPPVNKVFRNAFFGGRIETRLLGRLPFAVRAWDIHSAYPAEFAKLCTSRGAVTSRNFSFGPAWEDGGATYGAYRVWVSVPRDWDWGPLAVRSGNRILYPVGVFETWVGRPGLDILKKYGVPFRVIYACEIWPESPAPIFEGIPEMYDARKDASVSIAIKKVINSLYGVTAEQTAGRSQAADFNGAAVGAMFARRWSRFGKFANFVFASHCTESVRMKVWEALHALGKDAVFCATDGILCREGVLFPAVPGPNLGDWGREKVFGGGVVFGSGRYRLSSISGVKKHLRGFPPVDSNFDKLRRTKTAFCNLPSLEAASLYEWAAMTNADANVLADVPRRFEIKDVKRYWGEAPRPFAKIQDAFLETRESLPLILGNNKVTF